MNGSSRVGVIPLTTSVFQLFSYLKDFFFTKIKRENILFFCICYLKEYQMKKNIASLFLCFVIMMSANTISKGQNADTNQAVNGSTTLKFCDMGNIV